MTNQMNVKEAERRAQSRAVDAELKIMQQEQARAAEQERQAELNRRERDANIENIIVGKLSDLKPLYEKRQEAFDHLAAAVDDFMAAEAEIMPVLIRERNQIPGQAHMYPATVRQKWVQLAVRAGIPTEHSQFTGGSPISRTIAIALAQGFIHPGMIAFGGSTLNIEV